MLTRLLGALVIGVATLFVPKAEEERHWSIPPTFPVDEASEDDGDPSGPR